MTAISTLQVWPHDDRASSAKFTPPSLPRHLVRRERLDQCLSTALRHPVAIVSGPPGAGKSVAVADWAQGFPFGVVAWLTIDENDNDPGRLWQAASLALGAHPDECAGLDEWATLDEDSLVDRLLAQAGSDQARILVMDDFHLLTNASVIDSIARVAHRLPSYLRFVLAGQGAPDFPLQRFILKSEAAGLDDRKLRFTSDDCGALVALVSRQFVRPELLAELAERTEGWATGVYLGALGLREQEDPSGFLHSFGGTYGPVAEYLENEVLLAEPPDIVRFLLQTSVLQGMSPDLCNAVSGRADSEQILKSLARRHRFVLDSGGAEQAYRYHNLLVDLLRSRLEVESPSLRTHAHYDAASWFKGHGDARSAAHHFAEAGAYEQAFSLVFSDLFSATGNPFPPRCVTLSRREVVAGAPVDPGQIYMAAAALMGANRVGEAANALRRLDEATSARSDRQLWRGRAEFLWAVQSQRLADASAIVDHCFAAQELLWDTSDPGRRPSQLFEVGDFWQETMDVSIAEELPVLAARGDLWLGHLDDVRERLDARFGSGGAAALAQPGLLALAACQEGRLGEAYRLGNAALRLAATGGSTSDLVQIEARLALGEVSFELDELDAAEEHLDAALQLCRSSGDAHWVWAVEVDLVRLLDAQGHRDEALARVVRLRRMGLRTPPPNPFVQKLNHVEIGCRIRVGDLQGALLVARSMHPGTIGDEVLAGIDLCAGRPDRAVARLTPDQPAAAGAQVRRLVLLACAEFQQGRASQAGAATQMALDAAKPEGYVRPFLEHAPQMIPLLRLVLASNPAPYLADLVQRAERTVPGLNVTQATAILEPLTDRERQVLGYLPSHLSARDIATRIYVSHHTVRSHLKSIYRKVDASSRSEAVAKANALGLL